MILQAKYDFVIVFADIVGKGPAVRRGDDDAALVGLPRPEAPDNRSLFRLFQRLRFNESFCVQGNAKDVGMG